MRDRIFKQLNKIIKTDYAQTKYQQESQEQTSIIVVKVLEIHVEV